MSLLVGLQPVLSQESSDVTVDVEPCLAIESAEARLACFESRVGAAIEVRDAAKPGADNEIAAPQQRRTTPTEVAAAEPNGFNASRDAEAEEYSGTIVAIRERLPEAYLITLDNGQIWEQTVPKVYPLRPGLKVTIRPTRWGPSYRMTGAGAGSYIQVRRVQ